MKKLLATTLALLSATAFADTKVDTPTESHVQDKQPFAMIRVFDTSGKEPKLMDGNRLSRHKSRQVCVFVANVPIQEQNLFAEYFQAPKPMKIHFEGANVQAEDNQKNYLISFNMSKEQIVDDIVSQCWTFTKNDPIGTYKLDVQFNDIVFKGLEFKVLK